MTNNAKIIIALLAVLLIAGVVYFGSDKKQVMIQETQDTAKIANPASTNCVAVGGTLKVETLENGGQYGLCYFDDNRACEEWALFHGDCPVGGRKTTGFDTVDQKFCAWRGGETTANINSVCTFKDGTKCPTIDYYKGTCPTLID